jgi:hypothetical protein
MKNKYCFTIWLILVFACISYSQTIRNVPGSYATITAAITASNPGDTVKVASGTYTEDVLIDRSLVIKSTSGAASTIIAANTINGTTVTINSDNVTIDGLTITNPSGYYGIYSSNHSNITVKNNIVYDIGSAIVAPSSNVFGIAIAGTTTPIANISIQYNTIDKIHGGSTPTRGATGFAAGFSNGSSTLTGLTISNNTIYDIMASVSAKGAYGILINYGGTTSSPSITGNTIYNMEGLWAHGIGLEGNTPNAIVQNNNIYNLIDHKSPADTDATAIEVESNPSANTIAIHNNTFSNVLLGVRNTTPLTVDATQNYWGDNDPSNNVYNTGGGSINYAPWLGQQNNAPHPWNIYTNSNVNAAIALASNGDTIVIQTPGTYSAFVVNKSIVLIGSPGVVINHGSPGITVNATGVTITGFTFNYNAPDFAVDVLPGNYNVTIQNCDFLNTNGVNVGNGVRNQGTGNVTAINNFWGDPSGPSVGSNTCGSGCAISNSSSGTLTYSPWYTNLLHTTLLAAPTLTSPANLAVGVTVVPNFQWSFPIVGAPTYTIEIATDNAFSNIVFGPTAPSPATSTNFQLSPANALVNGVTYYWRINATVGAGTACNVKQFTTIAPAVPYLTNPSNGGILSGTTTTFAWYSGTFGIQYTLQIAQDLAFTVPITGQPGVDITTTTNTYYVLSNSILATGGTYYWRVISKTIAVTPVIIDYSSTWQFSMPGLPQPYASYPIGGVSIYNNPPTLYWYTGVYNPLVTQYVVRYRRSDHVSYQTYPYSPTDNYGTFATLSANYFVTIPAALDAGYQYFWEVASYDGTNFSAWSSEASFYVYSSVTLVVCYPSFPVGGGSIYSNPPTLYWYTNVYAPGLQFRVQYANNVSFTGPTTATGILTNSYTIPGALAVGHWYWRVAASFNGITWGSYSAPGDFDVPASSSSAAATVPTPFYPNSGVVVYVVNPSLSWIAYSTDALQFQVIVATDPTMGSGVLSNPILTSPWTSSSSYVLTGLTPGAVYYWQVRSRLVSNNLIISAWSTLAWFVESPGAAAVVPIAGSPIGGTTVNNNSAVLSWVLPAQSNSELTYNVQYSTKQDFSNATTLTNVKSTNVTVSNLDKGTTYYWRASSQTNSGSTSNYSGSGAFKTNGTTDVAAETVLPVNYELQQNYPNPFNPSTKISFSMPLSSFVTIKIYDMLGREVKTLANNDMPAGVHSLEWKGDNNSGGLVASGTYIYRINAGEFTATKKMVFLK